MHRLTRYRKICDKAARLGYNDLEPFDPGALSGEKWTWPSPTEPTGCWYYQRDEDKQKISIPPSTLTWAEQIYLAFYNLDPYFQKKVSGKEEDIWKQNLYSEWVSTYLSYKYIWGQCLTFSFLAFPPML